MTTNSDRPGASIGDTRAAWAAQSRGKKITGVVVAIVMLVGIVAVWVFLAKQDADAATARFASYEQSASATITSVDTGGRVTTQQVTLTVEVPATEAAAAFLCEVNGNYVTSGSVVGATLDIIHTPLTANGVMPSFASVEEFDEETSFIRNLPIVGDIFA